MMFYALLFLAIYGHLASADQEQQLILSSVSSNFSQRLYQKVALDKPSVIYSPYSIHSSLTMTLLGARGDTADEMRNTLGVTSLGDTVHETYKELIQQINSVEDVKLFTGNAIFANPKYQIVPKFMQDTANYYFAKADNINMSANGGPETPINDYIANKTENIIRNVLKPGTIDNLTLMLLVNTIFFNGTWDKAFNKDKTIQQDFILATDGVTTKIEMMHDNRITNIKRDNANGVDVAELPFKGGRFSLYIALPQQFDGITNLEKLLSQPAMAEELFNGLKHVHVQLAIPKFKTETTLKLKETLKSMGMAKAFTKGNADFTGIFEPGNAYISEVIHKVVIDVQENGTVAAAATVIQVDLRSMPQPFIADHPFVYFLRDNQNKQILFQGKFSG